ncbi:MAG: hydrogenase maturation protease [Chloroflexi bacterium]|nr:hydrogenase maturation protease [Chloroflexota bacterium]
MVEPDLRVRPAASKCLVIGIGNTLRGDDGLGPVTVAGLETMIAGGDSRVRVLALPQLDVLLAAEMSEVDTVIVVDAREDDNEDVVRVERVEPTPGPLVPHHTSHTIGAAALLRMAQDWYGSAPICYTVMPKGYDFSISENISDGARLAAERARDTIVEILVSGHR